MLDAISDPLLERVSWITASQIGKTELILNACGYHISQDPAPILVVMPTRDLAMSWSKDRLTPMLRDTPCLRGAVSEPRVKDGSSNQILHKSFRGGHITMVGANAPSGLASRPVRIVLMDEVDRFPATAGKQEGDPSKLAEKRTQTFWNRKIIMASSPTVKDISRIELSWQDSDMRRFFVPCPRCGAFQVLVWAGVKFDKADVARSVHYECEHCKAPIADAEKYRMVRHGEWRAEHPERVRHAGFHVSELYSPWSSWRTMVENFLEAKQRRETLRVFLNTSLGECWEERESYTIDDSELTQRVENYTNVPEGALVLTAGVDVQDDRLECLVKGWGKHDESWLIDRQTFWGSPGRADTWGLLDGFLLTVFEHASGVKMRIVCVCIDSGGHFTQNVYEFVRTRHKNRYFAVKGMGGYGRPLIGKWMRTNKRGAVLIPLGVDTAKELIYDRLKIEKPSDGSSCPGYMHFNRKCDEAYFHELTAEKQVVKHTKGFPTKVWELISGRANHALDCEVYALAAFKLLNANMERVAANLKAHAAVKTAAKSEPPAAEPQPTEEELVDAPARKSFVPTAGEIKRGILRKNSFANRWKSW